jgi:aldehyde:ferredoxin oxidoreductase
MKKVVEKGYPYRNRDVLVIDLTKDEYSYSPINENIGMKYHGGRALAYKLWEDYVDWNTINKDCLYVGAPIILSLGSASDLGLDYASSATILTYSLESQSVVSYNFSSQKFVSALSSLGFSALVIKGRARRLTSVEIWENKINIDICENFHNLNTRDIELFLDKASSLLSISSSGEKSIDYASINIDSKNVGRAGIGAIFGIKNLKCIAIYEKEDYTRAPYYDNLVDEVQKYFINQKDINYLEYANKFGWAAIEGYKYRYDPRLWGLGGDLTPECELDWLTALSLGSNLGIYDYKKVEILEECCLSLAIDPLSISNYLIWLLEAEKQKVVNLRIDKNNDKLDRLIIIIEYLATSKGHFSMLNEGVDILSEKYGFNQVNFTSSKKELLPIDLRAVEGLSLATALDDDTLVPWELFGSLKKKNVVQALWTSQIYREICESLGVSWKSVLYLAYKDIKFKNSKNRFMRILTQLFAISEGYKISEEDLLNFGIASFFKRRSIEEKSKKKFNYSIDNIPIYFLTNSHSNFKKETVVSVGAQLDKYLTLLKYQRELLESKS